MRVAKLTLEQGLFRLNRLTAVLSWLLPVSGVMMAIALVGTSTIDGMRTLPSVMAPAAILGVIAALLAIILSSMWLSRANANLRAAGRNLKHGPVMAWLWTFVPVAGLFKPYDVMREIWRESVLHDGQITGQDTATLPQWWGAWLVAMIGMNLSNRAGIEATEFGRFVLVPVVAVAGFAACILLRSLVRAVNHAQASLAQATVFA